MWTIKPRMKDIRFSDLAVGDKFVYAGVEFTKCPTFFVNERGFNAFINVNYSHSLHSDFRRFPVDSIIETRIDIQPIGNLPIGSLCTFTNFESIENPVILHIVQKKEEFGYERIHCVPIGFPYNEDFNFSPSEKVVAVDVAFSK